MDLFNDKIALELKSPEFSELITNIKRGEADPYESAEDIFTNSRIELSVKKPKKKGVIS